MLVFASGILLQQGCQDIIYVTKHIHKDLTTTVLQSICIKIWPPLSSFLESYMKLEMELYFFANHMFPYQKKGIV